jgi:hypothetical protein
MGLDIVQLVMALEEEFGLRLPDEELKRVRTVGELYDYIGRQLAPALVEPQGGPYEGALWARYLDVIEKDTGLERDRLRPGASFVHDLDLQ